MNSGKKPAFSQQTIDTPPKPPSSKNEPSVFKEQFLDVTSFVASGFILGGCLLVFTLPRTLKEAAHSLYKRSASFVR